MVELTVNGECLPAGRWNPLPADKRAGVEKGGVFELQIRANTLSIWSRFSGARTGATHGIGDTLEQYVGHRESDADFYHYSVYQTMRY